MPGRLFRSAVPSLLAGLLLALAGPPALAATLRVGPGGLATIAEAARLAQDGDVVEIAAGTYRGDIAVWTQRRLTLRGVGGRPELVADGQSAEGKAIWVIRHGDFEVDNIAFRGARVEDGNGAGIRFEKGRLAVRGCVFEDNENGLLTANFEDAELTIRDSLFAHAPRDRGLHKHLLYVGRIARLTVEGSRFHDGFEAHLVKSRARVTELRHNLIWDGAGGRASYEVDLPNGGDATLVGNILGKSATPTNPILVSFGAEGARWPVNRLRMVHNTMVNEGWRPARFAHVWRGKLGRDAEVVTENNLTAGIGVLETALAGRHAGNRAAWPWLMRDPAILEFSLRAGGWLWDALLPAPAPELAPRAEFALPLGTRPLAPPRRWLPGAIQAPAMPVQDGLHLP